MANIELLAEITASGMYIFDNFTKVFFGIRSYNIKLRRSQRRIREVGT
jgi:hypothetical protein